MRWFANFVKQMHPLCSSNLLKNQANQWSSVTRRAVPITVKTEMAKKMLIGLDFDHTVIDENSDIYVQRLAPDGKIPKEIKELYSSECWTDYMQAIFAHLHQHNINQDQITACMQEIPLTQGMPELFQELSKDRYEVIIISDSNTLFIDTIMKHQEISPVVHTVYSNPAAFDNDGCLRIQYYHTQDWCDMSTRNLCKGHILDEHISKRKEQGVTFDRLAFVGDGTNDICPCLRMNTGDIAFARRGFRIDKKIDDYEGNGLQATVQRWNTGLDVLNSILKL